MKKNKKTNKNQNMIQYEKVYEKRLNVIIETFLTIICIQMFILLIAIICMSFQCNEMIKFFNNSGVTIRIENNLL